MRLRLVWAVLLSVVGGCAGGSRQLVIDFFDFPSEALSTESAIDDNGLVLVAGPDFQTEPRLHVTEADITSWDPEGSWGHRIELARGPTAAAMVSLVDYPFDYQPHLVFRLCIDHDCFWGFVTTIHVWSPGNPSLLYESPSIHAGAVVLWLGAPGSSLNGVSLEDAAWRAWQD